MMRHNVLSNSISSIQTAMPIRFLGMGLYLAWLYSAHYGAVLFPQAAGGSELTVTFFVANIANAICLIFCAMFARKLSPLAKKPSTLRIAGISATLGTLLGAFGGAPISGSIVIVAIGAALSGIGTALLILAWSEFFASLPIGKVSVYYSASFILATIINYIISFMIPLVALVMVCILPIVSVLMLSFSMRALEENSIQEPSHDYTKKWTFPYRPVILMAAYSFSFNFIRHSENGITEFGMIGVGLIALVVLLISVFFFNSFDVRLLHRVALPLMVAALLIQSLFGSVGLILADILANASYAGFVILTMIILSNICYRYGVIAVWLFGITRAVRVVSNVMGAYVGKVVLGADAATVNLIVIAIVIVLVIVSMFLFNESDYKGTWGIAPRNAEDIGLAENYYANFVGRCAQIARQYGLTHREEEVLALLAQGKSIPRIEKDLFISNSTVKSHVHHIYTKLDIHSRDELLDIVDLK